MLGNQEELILPKLREDLKLLESSPAEDGTKQWMIFDAITNKYFTIGIDSFLLISYWESGIGAEEFLKKLKDKDYELDNESLSTFINFLKSSGLTKNETLVDTKRIYEQKLKSKQSIFKWLIHNYLFIKLPIFKPDKWLSKNYHKVDFLYTKLWSSIVLVLGIIGILLVIRDWDAFSSTFMYLFSKEGILYYGISLIFVKSLHELGHAFTAKRYGCKIPSMGIAFLVMFPVLYTDSTNAYALKSKYKRLKIAIAGMKVEIYLALLATFLWSFLPEGPLKSIAFIIATTSWITSLLVNISPFLRFDGYYVLSDWTNTKNLQPRSFATTKWFIRKYILGLEEDEPENLSTSKKRFFIIYAILTWIYRFFLFLGIAFLVYYFAFKVLGIILFLVEIVWFILLPVYNELKVWYQKRELVSFNIRNIISLGIFISILIVLFTPWNSKIYMPAVIEAKNLSEIYSPKDAYIKRIFVKNEEEIKKGEVLLEVESEDLNYRLNQANRELEVLLVNQKREAASIDILRNKFIIQENIYKKENEIKGLLEVKKSLTLIAPFDGIVNFIDIFKVGQYINKNEAILTIYDLKTSKVIGYCKDTDYKYLIDNAKGKFVSNIPELKSLDIRLSSISKISLVNLEYRELSSIYGGDIATRESTTNDKKLLSENAYFKVEASIVDIKYNLKNRIDGTLIVESQTSSFIQKVGNLLYNILVKESGF